jgi:hypothetical protein
MQNITLQIFTQNKKNTAQRQKAGKNTKSQIKNITVRKHTS